MISLQNKSCDIFSLGCVFFFVLTNGQHPFGPKPLQRPMNIQEDKKVDFCVLKDLLNVEWAMLIKHMIANKPNERPTAEEILKSDSFLANTVSHPKNKPLATCLSVSYTSTDKQSQNTGIKNESCSNSNGNDVSDSVQLVEGKFH